MRSVRSFRGVVRGGSPPAQTPPFVKDPIFFLLNFLGNFSEMKNDGYIHRNLLRHMLRAGLIEEAQQLIRDLKWLAAKLDVTGPADLLNDYLAVKGHEDSKVTTQHHKECFK